MVWKRTVRFSMKTFISLISLGVILTSIIGLMSIVSLTTSSADNIQFDTEGTVLEITPSNNYFSSEISFTNDGYFNFENFTIGATLKLQNKTSGENFTILDEILYQNTLEVGNSYLINITATNSSFDKSELYQDMGNSWLDPYIVDYMEAHPEINWTEIDVNQSSFPYLLSQYDIHAIVAINSDYNLGLVEFNIGYEQITTFDDIYPGQTYEELRNETIEEYVM